MITEPDAVLIYWSFFTATERAGQRAYAGIPEYATPWEHVRMAPHHDKRAQDPQELEPMLIARAQAGDVDGMVALYETDAVVVIGAGALARGHEEIRTHFSDLLDSGFVFDAGRQFPAVVNGSLALTSSRYPNGTLSSEVARQQEDGTWLWILDYPTLGD